MPKSCAGSVLVLLFGATLASTGCGDSKDEAAGSGGTSGTGGSGNAGAGNTQCPNLAGSWTVAMHCQSALVGSSVQVSQSGCSFTDETYGFSGMVRSDGTLTVSSGTLNATCTGTATAKAITENCTVGGQPCTVSLTR